MVGDNPKIYHILPIDKLDSVLTDGFLYSEKLLSERPMTIGSNIGITEIKNRRLTTPIPCCSGLFVGECVPFYYCFRSVMLYLIFRGNHPKLSYLQGQHDIIHLEFDLKAVFAWAKSEGRNAVITDRNAGTSFFEAWTELDSIKMLDWEAIDARDWKQCKDRKQAEFLVEKNVSVSLIERIGVIDEMVKAKVTSLLKEHGLSIAVEVHPEWYY